MAATTVGSAVASEVPSIAVLWPATVMRRREAGGGREQEGSAWWLSNCAREGSAWRLSNRALWFSLFVATAWVCIFAAQVVVIEDWPQKNSTKFT